jgi:hypothetical protein
LLLVFTSFLVTPAIINLSGNQADVSTFFSMNEEENSSKIPKPNFAFVIEKIQPNCNSLEFLKIQQNRIDFQINNYANVFLEVISPPPRIA